MPIKICSPFVSMPADAQVVIDPLLFEQTRAEAQRDMDEAIRGGIFTQEQCEIFAYYADHEDGRWYLVCGWVIDHLDEYGQPMCEEWHLAGGLVLQS